MDDEIFPPFPREYTGTTLNAVINDFLKFEAPGTKIGWAAAGSIQKKRKVCKLGAPDEARDAALKRIDALRKRLPPGNWVLSVGRPAYDAPFSFTVTDEELPDAAKGLTETKGFLGRIASILGWVKGQSPSREPTVPESEVQDKLQAALKKAFKEQPPPPGKVLQAVTIEHVYSFWATPLKRWVPRLEALLKKSKYACAADLQVRPQYVVASLDPDRLAVLQKHVLSINLQYTSVASGSRLNGEDNPGTEPPESGIEDFGTLPPAGFVRVTVRKGMASATGDLPLASDGTLTLQRVNGTALFRLFEKVQAERDLSGTPTNALQLRVEDTGAKVIAEGDSKRFKNQVGQKLPLGSRLAWPIQLKAGPVRIEIHPV